MDEMTKETRNLNKIIQKYDEFLEDTKLECNNVYKLNANKEDAEKRKSYLLHKIDSLESNSNKPYFARLNFENENGETDDCYIGKIGVSDYDNNVIIVDWRAPISSLYYDSNIGKTNYKVDDDIISGQLKLKRQYEIENRTLISFNDVDTVSNDEFLKPFLGVTADSRIKNIVATIQKEQNDIIRNNLYKNLIIQGVAGSGKTTVALHRIAYLAYNYRNLISNNQYMIIGPNKFFVNYISKILPDLDVNDVAQYDLIELTENYIGKNLILEDENEIIQKYLNDEITNLPKIKTSFAWKNIIDNFLNDYHKNILKDKPISIRNFNVIEYSTIKKYWNEACEKNYEDLKSTIERCIILLYRFMENNESQILSRLNEFIDLKVKKGIPLEQCRKDRDFIMKKIKSNIKSIIRNHFDYILCDVTKLYSHLIDNIENYTSNEDIIKNIDHSLRYEDLTSLIYLNYKINGFEKYKDYRHIVIDEAQDYNDFTFYALTKMFPKASFNIYGDIAQSIYAYRSLDSWDTIKENVFHNTIEIKNLNKSYRTTIEIMSEANKINKHLNLQLADSVIRHGDKVEYLRLENNTIKISLKDLINQGYKNIAIISKDFSQSQELAQQLQKDFEIQNITNKEQEYNEGICIIPCHLCKGLEFDCVIINNASDNNFNLNNNLDMKLLYVAMTRALHKLVITYQKNLINILK